MMTAALQRPAGPPMAYRLHDADKDAATLIAKATWGGILVTMSRTDTGLKSWILTRGPHTREVTTLSGLATAIAEMRGA